MAAGAVEDELFSDLPDEDEPDESDDEEEDEDEESDPAEPEDPLADDLSLPESDEESADFAPVGSLSFFFAASPEPLRLSVR